MAQLSNLTKNNITLAGLLLCYYIIYTAAVKLDLRTAFFGLSLFGFAFYRYLLWQRHKAELKLKGLTPGDISNIAFVKEWDVTRKTGAKRYCLIEGGLMIGLILFLPISLIIYVIVGADTILSSSQNLLLVAVISLGLGYIIGVAIYLNRWVINERRFVNLTDPLRNK